ncbi:MAG: DinB family protein [Microlunatus sp.]
MSPIDAESYPDLDADERTTLSQFLDQYRQRALSRLIRLSDVQARTQTLAATNLTPGGVVKHLAHMEDHWFTARVGGGVLPEPWISAPFDTQPAWDFESASNDSVAEIRELYRTACERSRSVAAQLPSLDTKAPRPSFGKGPVTLRWVMVHMLEETACHVGHLDLLTDPLVRRHQDDRSEGQS